MQEKRILMHKNIEVARVVLVKGKIVKVEKILCPEHLPVGTNTSVGMVRLFQAWQEMRTIPFNRVDMGEIKEIIGESVNRAALRSRGLSLTDCYWFKEEKEDLQWEDINFWQTGFGSGQNGSVGLQFPFSASPDFSTDGCLSKTWVLIGKTPSLLKLEKENMRYMCANEVVAYAVANYAGVAHVPYSHIAVNNLHGCICPCFVAGDDQEYVPMQAFLHEHHGIALDTCIRMLGMEQFAKEMLAFDFLLGNIDRHEKNFGYLRNPDTLEFLAPAPLFDSGYCLCEDRTGSCPMKPYWEDRSQIRKRIDADTILVPEEDILKAIVCDVYQTFAMQEKAEKAVKEIIKNRKEILG